MPEVEEEEPRPTNSCAAGRMWGVVGRGLVFTVVQDMMHAKLSVSPDLLFPDPHFFGISCPLQEQSERSRHGPVFNYDLARTNHHASRDFCSSFRITYMTGDFAAA